jgi:hypothetical protein
VREAIRRADDEGVEGVLRIQAPVLAPGGDTIATGAGGSRARAFSLVVEEVGFDGVGGVCDLVDLILTGWSGDARVHRDGEPDLASELGGEGGGHHRPQPRLEDVLGEVIGCGDEGSVLDQAQRPREGDEGALLRGQGAVAEGFQRLCP